MRTVTYGAACSLDGFIAGPAGEIDWLHYSQDVHDHMASYWKGVDTILMGRKTWDVAQALGSAPRQEKRAARTGDAKAPPRPANPYAGMHTYVFSRTITSIDTPGVELVRQDAATFVRELKAQSGRGICLMGGGELAASLLGAGVVDEVGLNIHPVLLGRGVPMFVDAGRCVALELMEQRTMDGGCMLITYRVRP
jgi:dihydrofolate reductase